MELYGWKWCHIEFYKFFIKRCPVWPNATTGKWFSIKQSSRVWHALEGDTSINLPSESQTLHMPNSYQKTQPLLVSML